MSDSRKSVLVTGCSPGGIGHSLAQEFHAKGFRVFATARQASTISDLANEGVETFSLEVDKPSSIAALKRVVEGLTGGRLDYLVNNAGRNYTVPALDVDFDEVQTTFEVNVFAVMRMVQTFAPLLIEARGTIVQIGSLAGIIPYVFGSTYNASKAALHAYSNTLRVEMEPLGVNVVTIVTGGVQSNIARNKRTLADGSYYLPVSEEYERRVSHSQEGAMPNKAYAQSVVSHVTSQNKPIYVWEGNKSWLVWFVYTFLPKRWLDHYMHRLFNLWKLSKSTKSKSN